MRLERLERGHVLAAIAALALLLTMAMDWYGTHLGDEARAIEERTDTRGAAGGEIGRALNSDAQAVAEREESNAWQADALVDRILLLLLLASVALPLAAAVLRSQGRRFDPPLTPSAFSALLTVPTALFIAYRILNLPGNDSAATLKTGPWLALLALVVVAVGSLAAYEREQKFAALRDSARAGA